MRKGKLILGLQFNSVWCNNSGPAPFWADGTPVPGQQFEYAHDDIGNRISTKAGGNESGAGLRVNSYGVNTLNQYTARTNVGAVDVMGVALASATVTVSDGSTISRRIAGGNISEKK